MQLLLCAKQMPIECVRTITAAGGIPTWQQLAAAARNGHCVYQWLEACMTQSILQLPGMTALAEAVMLCSSNEIRLSTQRALDSADMQRLFEEQPSQADWLDTLFVVLQTPANSGFVPGMFRLLGMARGHATRYSEFSDIDAQIASPQQRQQYVQWRSWQLAAGSASKQQLYFSAATAAAAARSQAGP
jgi:hypothetical protein